MKHHFGRFASGIALMLLLSACVTQQKAVLLDKANPLPLQLDDSYQFKKTILFLNKPSDYAPTRSEAVQFERQYHNWGAITAFDYDERSGNYLTFIWKSTNRSDVTVRLEYRQAGLSNYVQAQELYYPAVKGTQKSDFQVTGDDFLENGRVTAWRAVLIVDGKIVALTQSYMWQ